MKIHKNGKIFRSSDEKKAIIAQIRAGMKSGQFTNQAQGCKHFKISPTNFFKWNRGEALGVGRGSSATKKVTRPRGKYRRRKEEYTVRASYPQTFTPKGGVTQLQIPLQDIHPDAPSGWVMVMSPATALKLMKDQSI